MSERTWIIECLVVVAFRVPLNSGEVLVATRSGRLVIVIDQPELSGLCVLRTGDDAGHTSYAELQAKLEEHCFANME